MALPVFPHELDGGLFVRHAQNQWDAVPIRKAHQFIANTFVPA